MLKILLATFLFLSTTIFAEDARIAYVQQELTHLPAWCQPSYLFHKPDIANLSITTNSLGQVQSMKLMRDGVCLEEILCEWEKGEPLPLLERVTIVKQGLTHIFQYDSNDCPCTHIIVGNLTGDDRTSQQQYWIETTFDGDHRPLVRREENGKKTTYSYGDRPQIIESAETLPLTRGYQADGSLEEIVITDGEKIERHWKKTSTEGSEMEVLIGCGSSQEEGAFLRREVIKNSVVDEEKTSSVHLFDANGVELFPSKNGVNSDYTSLLLIVGCPDYDELDDESLIPQTIEYTGRNAPSTIIYTNGKRKQLRYFPDGQLKSILYPNGGKASFEKDCFGRKIVGLYYQPGAFTSFKREYQYDGLVVSGFTDSLGYSYTIKHDQFNRPTEFCQFLQETCIQKIQVCTDGLERVVGLTSTGKDRYQKRFEYRENETLFHATLFPEEGPPICTVEHFDAQGLPISRKIGKTVYTFDSRGRIASIEKDGLSVVKKEYLAKDGLIEETSHFPDRGFSVEIRHPSDGKLVRRTWYDHNAKEVLREVLTPLDEYGSTKLEQITPKNKKSIEWTVGKDQHIQKILGPNGRSTTYAYDAGGRLVCQKTGSGRTIFFEYENNRLKRLYAQDMSIDYRYSYDEFGRIIEAVDAVVGKTCSRKFDPLGRLVFDGEPDSVCTCTYKPNGAFDTLCFPDSSTILYGDESIKIVGTKEQVLPWKTHKRSTAIPTHSLDALGQLVKEEGATCHTYSFDAFGTPLTAQQKKTWDKDGNCLLLKNHDHTRKFVYDALGRLKRCESQGHTEAYRYDGFNRLVEIVHDGVSTRVVFFDTYDLGSLRKNILDERRIIHPKTKSLLYLELQGKIYQPSFDRNGSILSLCDIAQNTTCAQCAYNAFGAHTIDPKAPSFSYRFYGKRLLPLSGCLDFGPRRLQPDLMRWLEADPLGIVDTIDDRIFCRNNPILFSDESGLFPKIFDFAKCRQSFVDTLTQMVHNTYRSITFAKNRLEWAFELRKHYEDLFFTLMGRSWLNLLGYNPDPTSAGITDGNEPVQKVRITLINGILNGSFEAQKTAKTISKFHGDVPVHYVYSATCGFVGDLCRGAAYKVGYVSEQAKILVNLWRSLIVEMGGVDGGGLIWHYAHSMGATDTAHALKSLTPKERTMLRVAAFGALTIIDADACSKVDNYISVHDGIPLLDPLRYIMATRTNQPHVHFLPSTSPPFMDHLISGATYNNVLYVMGQEFQDAFLRG